MIVMTMPITMTIVIDDENMTMTMMIDDDYDDYDDR